MTIDFNRVHVNLAVENMAENLRIATIQYCDQLKEHILAEIKEQADSFDFAKAIKQTFDKIVNTTVEEYVKNLARTEFNKRFDVIM